ncbi:MAG: hypothetical protein ACYCZR_10685 [Burkholderiales bacterium]
MPVNYPKIRKSLYKLGVAAGAVAMVYGVASGEQVAVWLGVFSAALNVMADLNVDEA